MVSQASFDRGAVIEELEAARVTFQQLVSSASRDDLRQPSAGTCWTNHQLLFHMLLGYLIVWTLAPLIQLFSRLPPRASETFVALLNRADRRFNAINYWGACMRAALYTPDRMRTRFDRVIAARQGRVLSERDDNLARGMHYPTRWDPFFTAYMTLGDVYRYPTRHFRFHERQLRLRTPAQG